MLALQADINMPNNHQEILAALATEPTSHAFTRAIKRLIDITGALCGLTLAGLPIAVLATLVRVRMGRPVFYRQNRAGQFGKTLQLWKFRTMTNERNADGTLRSDGERLTPLGRFLREYSLDELPQLFNVLTGEMSLVGPRPLLIRYLPRYKAQQLRRHLAKPGITGWAQVKGRNGLDWDTRLALDVWYAENWSLGLDIKIVLLTLRQLIKHEDVFAGAGAELEEFWGSAERPKDGTRAFPVEENELA